MIPAAAPDPGGGDAPPPIASRGPKPPTPGRGAAPALPPSRPTRGAAPPIPQAQGGEEIYDDGDDEALYGEIDEDDIYGGTAEQFDDSKLDAMMEDIYGVV